MADPATAALAFIDGLGGPEMVMVFVVVLILFGGQKLPEFARGLGKTMREFKKAASGVEEEFRRALEEDERKKYVPPPPAPMTVEPATALSPDEAANATADEISATEPLVSNNSPEPVPDPYRDEQSGLDQASEPAPEAAAEPAAEPSGDSDAGPPAEPEAEPARDSNPDEESKRKPEALPADGVPPAQP